MSGNTTPAEEIRAAQEQVMRRHHNVREQTGGPGFRSKFCVDCGQRWPCGARQMSEAVLTLVEALENNHIVLPTTGVKIVSVDRMYEALATVAAQLKGADDER